MNARFAQMAVLRSGSIVRIEYAASVSAAASHPAASIQIMIRKSSSLANSGGQGPWRSMTRDGVCGARTGKDARGRMHARLGIDVQPVFKLARGQPVVVEQIAAGDALGQMIIAGGGETRFGICLALRLRLTFSGADRE